MFNIREDIRRKLPILESFRFMPIPHLIDAQHFFFSVQREAAMLRRDRVLPAATRFLDFH